VQRTLVRGGILAALVAVASLQRVVIPAAQAASSRPGAGSGSGPHAGASVDPSSLPTMRTGFHGPLRKVVRERARPFGTGRARYCSENPATTGVRRPATG
jgi:hypothetical protein